MAVGVANGVDFNVIQRDSEGCRDCGRRVVAFRPIRRLYLIGRRAPNEFLLRSSPLASVQHMGLFPEHIATPLLNSASPWASTEADLASLWACPSTDAITTRTCTLTGYPDDPKKHQASSGFGVDRPSASHPDRNRLGGFAAGCILWQQVVDQLVWLLAVSPRAIPRLDQKHCLSSRWRGEEEDHHRLDRSVGRDRARTNARSFGQFRARARLD